ncbi:MAG TPA: glycosyl hydrolase [Candidatus Acidoferrales bacterium]|nr:glycosyl hydrolase [Candidatus Acidoferrales bacterium]
MEAYETWLGRATDSLYSVAYGPAAVDCVGGGSNCLTNTFEFSTWFGTSTVVRAAKTVWSLTLAPCDHAINISGGGCTTGHTVTLANVAAGVADTAYNAAFTELQSLGVKIIRLGWEMNGTSFTWAINASGGSTTSNTVYVQAFQHIAALAHTYGFLVDWCPGLGPASGNADYFYPGDAYADIIGEDFYDYLSQNFTFYQTWSYGLNWQTSFATLHGKPIAYDEWGCGGTDSTDAHCANIIAGMASLMQSNPVLYFNFWNSQSSPALSKQICDNGTAGFCGSPYQIPLSEAAFCTAFKGALSPTC